MFKYIVSLFIIAFILPTFAQHSLQLPKIFSDNMVLQRTSEVNIWGKAKGQDTVIVTGSWGSKSKTIADNEGSWKVTIRTVEAGGPYTLSIKTRSEGINFSNILLGDVWLCSGQSNMEMPMKGWPPTDTIYGAKEEIKNGSNKNLRLFTVQRNYSVNEENDVNGVWVECNSNNIADFSATGYFFGKNLTNKLAIPIGLIHSSWGGTPVEAWTPKSELIKFPKYKKIVEQFVNLDSINKTYTKWLERLNKYDVYSSTSLDRWKNIDLGDKDLAHTEVWNSNWRSIDLPTAWERTEIGDFDGVIWFKKDILLPVEFINQELNLNLGPIDDMDATYVNGVKIGSTEEDGKWKDNRNYIIPKEMTKSGRITIAVRVIDNTGGGGIYGNKEDMYIMENKTMHKLPIFGEWKYFPVAEFKNGTLYYWGKEYSKFLNRPVLPFAFSPTTPSVLFNGMIKPIIPFTIKGGIWYQGEGNTDYPDDYASLFKSMITSWRAKFGNDFSFYFTQIAPYRYSESVNSAIIREAQLNSLSIPKTGMAVTLDIGNVENIHPGNKSEVSRRLALCALVNDYNINVEYSGPILVNHIQEGTNLHLIFSHSEGLTIKKIKNQNNIWLVTKEGKKYSPEVQITGKELVIDCKNISSDFTVYYCFDNESEATIFNSSGLPASSFRLAINK